MHWAACGSVVVAVIGVVGRARLAAGPVRADRRSGQPSRTATRPTWPTRRANWPKSEPNGHNGDDDIDDAHRLRRREPRRRRWRVQLDPTSLAEATVSSTAAATSPRTSRDDEARRAPGRPRSARADEAIIEAVLDLLADGTTVEALSIEAVAARAGVGKATIYRRWPNKESLLVDAIACAQGPLPELTGESVRDDLLDAAAPDRSGARIARRPDHAVPHPRAAAQSGAARQLSNGSSSRAASSCARCCAAASPPASCGPISTSRYVPRCWSAR